MPILIRPAAAADIDEAFVWYERQRTGLGSEFLTAVQSALENVVAHPARYPVVNRETRSDRRETDRALELGVRQWQTISGAKRPHGSE